MFTQRSIKEECSNINQALRIPSTSKSASAMKAQEAHYRLHISRQSWIPCRILRVHWWNPFTPSLHCNLFILLAETAPMIRLKPQSRQEQSKPARKPIVLPIFGQHQPQIEVQRSFTLKSQADDSLCPATIQVKEKIDVKEFPSHP